MERDPTARTLALLSVLQSGLEHSAAELAVRLDVSERTVRRDASRLRQLGYSVEARPGPGSAYRLVPGLKLPPLLLDEDEVTAVVAGLMLARAHSPDDDAAVRALSKLERVLPSRLRRHAAATHRSTEVHDTDGPGVTTATLGAVADAVAEDGRLSFAYVDQHGRPSQRLVDPHRQLLRGGRWFVVGYDVGRDDWRIFRLDRVAELERVPGTFRRHPFPDESLEHWLVTDFGRVTSPAPAPRGRSRGTGRTR